MPAPPSASSFESAALEVHFEMQQPAVQAHLGGSGVDLLVLRVQVADAAFHEPAGTRCRRGFQFEARDGGSGGVLDEQADARQVGDGGVLQIVVLRMEHGAVEPQPLVRAVQLEAGLVHLTNSGLNVGTLGEAQEEDALRV